MPTSTDKKFMQRCLDLAKKGLGNAAPNPMVGCVIVYQNRIIGEGFHQQYGEAHAEVNAVRSVQKKDEPFLTKSTVYVSLEPCAHHGKTPPCADLLVRIKPKKVVIACRDPFPKVDGLGFEKLKKAGIEIEVGVLEQESLYLNRRFVTSLQKKRPYIVLKWAETADGFMGRKGENLLISNTLTQRLSHKWRSEEAAILVGENTLLTDNPSLTVRHWSGKSPLRIAFQKHRIIPPEFHFLDGKNPSLLFTQLPEQAVPSSVEKILIPTSETDFSPFLFQELHKRNIQSLIVEGGSALLASFIEKKQWDEARIFSAPHRIGSGILAPKIEGTLLKKRTLDDNLVTVLERV